MDKQSAELAQLGMSYLDQELSPMFRDIRENFLGSLAVSGASIESLRGDIDNDTHNREVISNFAAKLPGMVADFTNNMLTTEFASKKADTMLALQASTVFIEDTLYKERSSEGTCIYKFSAPFYVVGLDPLQQRLLIVSPRISNKDDFYSDYRHHSNKFGRFFGNGISDAVFIAQFKKPFQQKRLQEVRNHLDVSRRLMDSNAVIDVEKMFDSSLGILRASKDTPGFLKLKRITASKPLNYLSDKEMVAFNVMDNLYRLALAFGKSEELIQALEPQPQKVASPAARARRMKHIAQTMGYTVKKTSTPEPEI